MMTVAVITGSGGLIGSEAAEYFAAQGMQVVGIDNDMRRYFFGDDASTAWRQTVLHHRLKRRYTHHNIDIRDYDALEGIFKHYGSDIALVIHTAAQPSHDWAAKEPLTDFSINANGTLNLLEVTRHHAPQAVFIFTSTNKVYGDSPNRLPLVEHELRYEIDPTHTYAHGIREDMPIDQSLHSIFGVGKVAADVAVQEYGRYFGLQTTSLRGGCLTGPNHAGAQLHGFLAYLMRCTITGTHYTIFGYKGKQVRDNIHSADLITAMDAIYNNPRVAAVYNIGGGRQSNCSMQEAIHTCQSIAGRELDHSYTDDNRVGDHIWYISDLGKFKQDYPEWDLTYDVPAILREIYERNVERWQAAPSA
jgi:CDP-paratose 2-epimerase